MNTKPTLLLSLLAALFLFATSAGATQITGRSASGYGMLSTSSGSYSAVGSDLTQYDFACTDDVPCQSDSVNTASDEGAALIVQLTATPPDDTVLTIDLPSTFDGTWGLLTCSSGTQNESFTLCTPLSDTGLNSPAPPNDACDAAGSVSGDVFTLTTTSSCPGAAFVFDLTYPAAATVGSPTGVPEPGSLALLLTGLLSLGLWSHKRLRA